MLRVMMVCLALTGFGAAARAGELDREAAPAKPVVAAAPATATTAGSELDNESPAAAWHRHGYWGGGWGGYRGGWGGYGYRPYYGYGWGYRPAYYGGWGYRPYGGFYTGSLGWNLAYNATMAGYYSYAYPWGGYYGGVYPVGYYSYGYYW